MSLIVACISLISNPRVIIIFILSTLEKSNTNPNERLYALSFKRAQWQLWKKARKNVYRLFCSALTISQSIYSITAYASYVLAFQWTSSTHCTPINWILFRSAHFIKTCSFAHANARKQLEQRLSTVAMEQKLLEYTMFLLFRNIVKLDGFVSRLYERKRISLSNYELHTMSLVANRPDGYGRKMKNYSSNVINIQNDNFGLAACCVSRLGVLSAWRHWISYCIVTTQ